MRRLSLSMLAVAVAAIVVLITAVLAVALYDDINEARAKGDELQHEMEELRLLRQFQSGLFIEVGAIPAYLVVPEPEYVQTYEDARRRAASAIEQLRALEAHNAAEAVALDELVKRYSALTAAAKAGMDIMQKDPAGADLSPESIGAFVELF